VSPEEEQITGNIVALVATNQSKPAHVVNYLAEPRDLDKPILPVSGEVLPLLGWSVRPSKLCARWNIFANAGELG
jgi:hypothetical protein